MSEEERPQDVETIDDSGESPEGRPVAEAVPPETEVKGKEKKKKKSRRQLDEELAGVKEEVASYLDRLARLQAEFENYKKRQKREREEKQRSAKESILKELLPVLDNLERAVHHRDQDADPEVLSQGVELVLKQFRDVLARFGVEPNPALGQVFDPHLHEAMSRMETKGDPPDGTVVEEYQKGYLLDGKVLRPALVGVAKAAAGGGEEKAG